VSRRARIGIIIALIGIALAAAGIFFITRLVQDTLAPPPIPTPIPEVTENILVASRDIPLGGLLNSDDLVLKAYPVELIPRDALRNLESAIGKFTKEQVTAGEIILESNLADPTNVSHDLAFVVGPDQVLFAFPADDLMSQLKILQRGDLVDILVTISQPMEILDERGRAVLDENGQPLLETKELTFDAMQRISVQAVIADIVQEAQRGTITVSETGTEVQNQPQPTPAPSDQKVQAYVLALNPQDALVLKNLLDTGATYDIVLRSPNASQQFDVEPVFDEYLIDRYQFRIFR
jgi:Flp pilus assembly protein CpaB